MGLRFRVEGLGFGPEHVQKVHKGAGAGGGGGGGLVFHGSAYRVSVVRAGGGGGLGGVGGGWGGWGGRGLICILRSLQGLCFLGFSAKSTCSHGRRMVRILPFSFCRIRAGVGSENRALRFGS